MIERTTENAESASEEFIKPYCSVGAGQLTSFVWRTSGDRADWRFRFNCFRMTGSGRTTQLFRPCDLFHFIKLAQVLAAVLADDGCLPATDRKKLVRLANALDQLNRRFDATRIGLGNLMADLQEINATSQDSRA